MTRKELTWFAALLVALSVLLYAASFLIFRRTEDLFYYFFQDAAFLPISVLFVTLVVDRLLGERERRSRQYKMNMVIGAFYSSVGSPLLKLMCGMSAPGETCPAPRLDHTWGESEIRQALASLPAADWSLQATPAALAPLRDFLAEQREFMLRLLENPILLEHEGFTDLLWAIFHLQEELSARASLHNLPDSDLRHLNADAERTYGRLLSSWLEYMLHLKQDYPYLFSFAARTNPLRPGAHAEIE